LTAIGEDACIYYSLINRTNIRLKYKIKDQDIGGSIYMYTDLTGIGPIIIQNDILSKVKCVRLVGWLESN
jgi:hypothetical protein